MFTRNFNLVEVLVFPWSISISKRGIMAFKSKTNDDLYS